MMIDEENPEVTGFNPELVDDLELGCNCFWIGGFNVGSQPFQFREDLFGLLGDDHFRIPT